MQYSFLSFSVKKIMEFGLDIKDLAVLRYFNDFRESGRMNYETIEGEKYNDDEVSYKNYVRLSTEKDKGSASKCSSKTNILKDSSTIDTNLYKYIKEAS